MSAHFFFLSFL